MQKLTESEKRFIRSGVVTPLNESVNRKLMTVEEPSLVKLIQHYLNGNENFKFIHEQLENHFIIAINNKLESDLIKFGFQIDKKPFNFSNDIAINGTYKGINCLMEFTLDDGKFVGHCEWVDLEIYSIQNKRFNAFKYSSLITDIKKELTRAYNANKHML